MSSTLSRSRSLRKPAAGSALSQNNTNSSADNENNARTVSPSRLPLKGLSSTAAMARPTRAASTAVSKSEDSGAPTTSRSRPISGVFGGLGRSASVRQPPTASSSSTTTSSRPPISSRNRPPTTRPTSASGPSPTSSRPTTSSGLPSTSTAPTTTRGHARTKSSVTILTSSTILRPPSQTSSISSSSHQSSVRPPSTTRTFHTRQPSSTPTITAAAAPAAPSLRKPAFTTLQQHFSPAKSLAPKPLTSSFLAPPSPSKIPANIALSAETSRLQTELLQLHLLHCDADAITRQWHDSARRKLGDKFALLAREEEAVREEEDRVWGKVNAAALGEWGGTGGGIGGGGLDEKVGLLDGVVTTVWGLGEKGGRYTRLVRRFETWAEGVRGAVASREGVDKGGGGREVVFISDLDAGWKGDCEALIRKLGECRDVMRMLGRMQGQSSLATILGQVETLVDDMLAQMDLMLTMEREAVARENEWVRAVNRGGNREDDTSRAGAIWRAF